MTRPHQRKLTNVITTAKFSATSGLSNDINQQYTDWAKEEIDLQRVAAEERVASMQADGVPIPQYMLQMLSECGGSEIVEPTQEGQLPIIAVIGRPNTGKSTIVNKLSSNHKVGILCHLKWKSLN